MVVFGQKLTFSGKPVEFEQSGGIRAEVVVLGRKRLYSGKSGCIRAKWLYSMKLVLIGQKLFVFGQKLLYSGINCCIRAKWL